jgi:hypothetical protein
MAQAPLAELANRLVSLFPVSRNFVSLSWYLQLTVTPIVIGLSAGASNAVPTTPQKAKLR